MADYFKHELALVDSPNVGPRTRVWAWAHVMQGARVGADCNIGEHCFVEDGAVLGDRVTVKNGVSVWDGVTAEDDVFLGPACVLTNEIRPRSRMAEFRAQPTLLRRGCSIGANATVVCGTVVGHHALIGAAAVVTKDVPPHALLLGNPGRIAGWVCVCCRTLRFEDERAACECGERFVRTADGVERLGA